MTQTARTNFTQVPNGIIDSDEQETVLLGFIRFLRRCGRRGYFYGSLEAFRRLLKMAKTTVYRAIAAWVKAGWVEKEETETGMRITILADKLWEDNSERSPLEEKHSRSNVKQQSLMKNPSVSNRNSSVSFGNSAVPNTNTAIPQRNTAVPKINATVPHVSTKQGGNRGSNTLSLNTQEEYREGNTHEDEPITPGVPSRPPSSFVNESSGYSLLRAGLVQLSAFHLAPVKDPHDMEQACSEMEGRLASLVPLVGEQEALRGLETTILYLKLVEPFWKDHHSALTLVKVVKYHQEIAQKAYSWMPPANIPRLYPEPEVPAAQTSTQEFPQSCAAVTQANSPADAWGMTEAEAETLERQITEQYPGMKTSWGRLPDGRYVLGLFLEKDVWHDLYSPADWHAPQGMLSIQKGWAIEAWEQYAGAVARDERVAVAV